MQQLELRDEIPFGVVHAARDYCLPCAGARTAEEPVIQFVAWTIGGAIALMAVAVIIIGILLIDFALEIVEE